MSEQVVAFVTCPIDQADAIASALVERRLVACVNVIPTVTSVYRWDGAVERDDESLLVIKTVESQLSAIDMALRDLHPYDVFELVGLNIAGGSVAYLDWISAEADG